jgi:hypothetical protein
VKTILSFSQIALLALSELKVAAGGSVTVTVIGVDSNTHDPEPALVVILKLTR